MSLNLTKTVWKFDPTWLRVEASDAADAGACYVYFERNMQHCEPTPEPAEQPCDASLPRRERRGRRTTKPGDGIRLTVRWRSLRERLAWIAHSYARLARWVFPT